MPEPVADKPRKAKRQPKKPTIDLVQKYVDKWAASEKYKAEERSLRYLFQESCPLNGDVAHVVLKVCCINALYSTHVYQAYNAAIRIVRIRNFDTRLEHGDPSLVQDVARAAGNEKKNMYSFATKYCHNHKPAMYPIYDSYVANLLWRYNQQWKYKTFSKSELLEYAKFIAIIKAFRAHFGLEQYSLINLDAFLWMYGKEFEPIRYGKKNPA